MFIDARTLPKNTTIDADVCIIGAGAAGITLARELIGQPLSVCLLESGGFEYDFDTQALYRGRSAGFPYFPIEATRLRFFGGTTNHWSGACRPLDPIDFEPRAWVPHSGWPFGRDHLEPFYRRAHEVLQLGPFAYTAAEWTTDRIAPVDFSDQTLTSAVLQHSPPTRFGRIYRDEIGRAPNVRTYLNANVLDIETIPSGRAVNRLHVSSLARNDFFVSARRYVLATGGIENARLLLLSDRFNPKGLGNSNGLVGRFFMEHPAALYGDPAIIAPLRFPLRFYRDNIEPQPPTPGAPLPASIWGFITPSEQTLRRERLLNCGIAVRRLPKPDPAGVVAARRLRDAIVEREWPDDFWADVSNVIADLDDVAVHGYRKLTDTEPPTDKIEVQYWAEQQPNPDSRVYLGHERDALGQRRITLDWRLTEQDRANIYTVLQLFGRELGKAGLGRLRIDPAVADGRLETVIEGAYHHMGTTRMHADPKQGVVDANCRVHEVSNLYVAGSSVFPTVGHANPTLTIVALALRLADHFKEQITNAHAGLVR